MRRGENALLPYGIALRSSGTPLSVGGMGLSIDGKKQPKDGIIVWMAKTWLRFDTVSLRLIGIGDHPAYELAESRCADKATKLGFNLGA